MAENDAGKFAVTSERERMISAVNFARDRGAPVGPRRRPQRGRKRIERWWRRDRPLP